MSTSEEMHAIAMMQQTSLPMLVQRELERLILGGEFLPGAKLNEVALAEKLGVSRGPVREAFRMLEESGLVRQEKNCGVFVRQITLAEADEIYELRAALDELVGRKLATSITPQQSEQLHTMLEQMELLAEQNQIDAYSAMNLAFHDTLVRLAGNQKLLTCYRRLVNELALFRRTALAQSGNLPLSTREHRAIVDAITGANANQAARLMRQHVLASQQRMHHAQAAFEAASPASATMN